MGKCLVTKLNGIVDNINLKKLGELRLSIQKSVALTADARTITLGCYSPVDIEVIGGYFTDKTFSENYGTTAKAEANITKELIVSNNDCILRFINKSDVISFTLGKNFAATDFIFDLSELKYSGITTASFFNMVNLAEDISIIKDIPQLKSLVISNCGMCFGDIASLAGAKNLEVFIASYCPKIYGDVSNLANNSKLKRISLKGTATSGDLSYLPSSTFFISLSENASAKWKRERPSSSPIISIEGNPLLGTDVDAMLINQAKCSPSTEDTIKKIEVKGTKTSLSDSAVSSLQSKGYTISITPA